MATHSLHKRSAGLALALLLPLPTLGTLMYLWLTPGSIGHTCYTIAKLAILVIPIIWLRFVDKQRFSLSPMKNGGIGFGAFSGLAIAAAIGLTYWLLSSHVPADALRETAYQSGFDTPSKYLGLAAFLTIINAALEEYVWRWFVFTRFETLVSKHWAIALAAIGFTLHHIVAIARFLPADITALCCTGIFVGSVIWSWSYQRYRSIWPGYVSHAIVDAAVFAVGWKLLFG